MRRLTYTDGRGRVWQLDDPGHALVGIGSELRGWEYDYDLAPNGLKSARRVARDVSVDLWARADELNELDAAMQSDTLLGTAGKLTLDGEWEQSALAVSCEPSSVYGGEVICSIKLALLDGCWHREHKAQFLPSHADGGTALDMPHDHLHDLGETRRSGRIDTGAPTECPVRLTIYGQAVNPRVTIGGNVYAFDMTVTTGARLEVDGTGARKTIELIGLDGGRTDAFACGHRGAGRGGGEYCFEPIQPGEQAVQWDGSFGFDLRWWETRGGLPWT